MSNKMHKPFIQEIIERFKLPWDFFAFKSYFLLVIIGFGGLGVFIKIYELCKASSGNGYVIAQDMSTYAIAIIAASSVDLNLSLNINSKPSLTIMSISLIGVAILLMVLCFNIDSYWALLPAIGVVLIALLVWILANADNENLSDSTYYDKMRGKDQGHGKNWS